MSPHDFDLADLVTFAYPIGDMLLLFGVLTLLWRGAPRSSVTALRVFVTGIVVFIVADVIYEYITVHAYYVGGDRVDILWFVALTILFIAAGCQLRADRPYLRERTADAGSGSPGRLSGAREFAAPESGRAASRPLAAAPEAALTL